MVCVEPGAKRALHIFGIVINKQHIPWLGVYLIADTNKCGGVRFASPDLVG